MRIFIFGASIAWGAFDDQGGGRSERLKAVYMSGGQEGWEHSVYNLSISGNTTQDLITRFENELAIRCNSSNSLIVFAMGANDSGYNPTTGKSNVSQNDFRRNIDALIDMAKSHVDHIVFLSILNVDESRTMPVSRDAQLCYSMQRIDEYNKILHETVDAQGVHYLDMHDTLDTQTDFDDGIHPNDLGHIKIYNQVKSYIDTLGI